MTKREDKEREKNQWEQEYCETCEFCGYEDCSECGAEKVVCNNRESDYYRESIDDSGDACKYWEED